MGTRERLRREREVRRRRIRAVILVVAGGAALVFGLSRVLGSDEKPYDMSATRDCLQARALTVESVKRGDGAYVYPGLRGKFQSTPEHEFVDFDIYFAPSVSVAEDSEVLDSDRVPRRANVLFYAADMTDRRLTGCLKREDEAAGAR